MNTGAILNRINFGTAVAANRLPGARVTDWPAAAALRGAPRDAQIDGVVAALLGGEASPDTRAVLARGEHPLAAARDSAAASADVPAPDAAPEPRPRAARRGDPDASGRIGFSAAARAAVRPGGRPRAAFAAPPRLDPLAQLVALALGAPEFQRR
jgi:hypothetical protein